MKRLVFDNYQCNSVFSFKNKFVLLISQNLLNKIEKVDKFKTFVAPWKITRLQLNNVEQKVSERGFKIRLCL